MTRHFMQELDELQQQLLDMAGLVEAGIHGSVQAVTERDEAPADEVFANETRINQLEISIDEGVTRLFVQNPVASDLRLLRAIGKMNTRSEEHTSELQSH